MSALQLAPPLVAPVLPYSSLTLAACCAELLDALPHRAQGVSKPPDSQPTLRPDHASSGAFSALGVAGLPVVAMPAMLSRWA